MQPVLTAADWLLEEPLEEASIYDANGDGERDARPALPAMPEVSLRIEMNGLAEGGDWSVSASRYSLPDPLRLFIEGGEDLQGWARVRAVDLPAGPADEGAMLDITLPMTTNPEFFRLAADDYRVLDELTPEKARNLWARLLDGCLSVINAAGTMGDGTRGTDTHGRVFSTTDYEIVMRPLWSVGAWFYHPGRPSTLDWSNPGDGSSGTVDVAAFALNALRNGPNPTHPQRWPDTFNGGNLSTMQPSVEAANVAWATWAMQRGYAAGGNNSPWGQLTSTERTRINNWLALHGNVPGGSVNNGNIYNWNLFFAVNHEARKRLAGEGFAEFTFTQSQIDNARAAIDDLHRGGGWYSDFAAYEIYDDYVPWTFATHLVLLSHLGAGDATAATTIPGRPGRDRSAILSELREFFSHSPSFYDIEGSNPEFGRSASYKVARLAGLLVAYAADRLAATEAPGTWDTPAFPAEISAGELKRLVRLHLNHYLRNEMIHWPSGLIREGVTPESDAAFLESYLSRGSTYWNMILFAGLWLIPDDDPFWTEPEEPLPAQVSDYGLWLETPGWFVSHLRERGDVRLYNLRSGYRTDFWAETQYHAKYAKFSYSSRFGFLHPNASRSDQMIRVDGGWRQLSAGGDTWPVDNPSPDRPPVLRSVHVQGSWRISSLFVLHGDLEVRVHRVTGATSNKMVREGSFALGNSTGESLPAVQSGADWKYIESSRGSVLHATLLGYPQVMAYTGSGNHSRDPAWRILIAEAPGFAIPGDLATLQCARATPFDPAAVRAEVVSVQTDSTSATVTFADGRVVTAPFLP